MAEPPEWRKLTRAEERVIVQKGTEAPFTGEYDAEFRPGTYSCRRCGAVLYRSEDKFHSGCGWPSFDQEVPGAVRRLPDGERVEIQCAKCGAHLGHVFEGERMTPKNTRHCVNSISMVFHPSTAAATPRPG
jgi:methionine-R-sulfoxide reductase